MLNIKQQVQRLAERYQATENTTELKDDMMAIIAQVNDINKESIIKPIPIGNLAKERLNQLKDSYYLKDQIIPIGFEDFDNEFSGLIKGELVVVGARPGMGKTQFIVNICNNIAIKGKPVAYVSLELSPFLAINRFIGNLSKVSTHHLLKGDLNEQDDFNVKDAVRRLDSLPIYILDQYNSSIFSIIENCRSIVKEHKVEAVFIDYFQLISAPFKRYNREAELAFISRELKKLAKELHISIVVASQLSRNVENRPGGSKRPQLADLRESGAIEQDADKVLFLYRPEYYGIEFDENNEPTRNVMEVLVAKNKTGSLETIRLMAEKYFTGFKKYKGPYNDLNISNDRLNDLF